MLFLSQLVKKSHRAFFAELLSELQNKFLYISYFATPAAAAGYWTRKETLTVSFSLFSSLRYFWLGSFLTVCSLVFSSHYTCFRRNAQAFAMGKGPHPVMPGGGHGFCRYYIASMYRSRAGSSLVIGSFSFSSPCTNSTPQPSPPAMPMSASRASPGPFTTQPMTATAGLVAVLQGLLHAVGKADEIDLRAAARRAGDEIHALLPQTGCLEDRLGRHDLAHGSAVRRRGSYRRCRGTADRRCPWRT